MMQTVHRPACCAGAKAIANQANTKNDRQAVYECLKEALEKVGSYDPSRVPLIAEKCGVDVYMHPITGEIEYCSKYQSLPSLSIFQR